jgi:hypothetical protein
MRSSGAAEAGRSATSACGEVPAAITSKVPDGHTGDGTKFLVDRRVAARLPAHFALTMRGLGPFRHIDLDFDGEQWCALLYD